MPPCCWPQGSDCPLPALWVLELVARHSWGLFLLKWRASAKLFIPLCVSFPFPSRALSFLVCYQFVQCHQYIFTLTVMNFTLSQSRFWSSTVC